jgi:hypothetical protein
MKSILNNSPKSGKNKAYNEHPKILTKNYKNKTQILSNNIKFDINQDDIKNSQNDNQNNNYANNNDNNNNAINHNDKKDKDEQILIKNYAIFEKPEDLKLEYDLLTNKIKKDLEYYNELSHQIQMLKNNKNVGNNHFLIKDEQIEKCYKRIKSLKKDNSNLKNKIKLYTRLNKIGMNKDLITNKIRQILLRMKSIINFEKEFNIYKFESNLEKYENENLQTKAGKDKTKSQFLMQTLEKIIKDSMRKDKLYRDDLNIKYQYRKIKANQEKENIQKRRIIQINKLKKKDEEKNKKIIKNFNILF